MIRFSFQVVELKKRFPLTISRGTSSSSFNLYVIASDGTRTGLGELAPADSKGWTAENGERQLEEFLAYGIEGLSIHEIYSRMRERQIDPPAMAALDMALWDLFAKECNTPLYRIFGLGLPHAESSITAGLNPPEITSERVPEFLRRTNAKCLKIKLGSPEGTDFDCAHFEAAAEAARPFGARLRVDANGGWDVPTAKNMMKWLSERGVDYVEQPLKEGDEELLPELYENRPLPIFVDESCRFASDVPKFANAVDGVNLKLMKCGGLTEALRIVSTARAHGLQTMIGCMSESSVAISAGAAIGALFDHIDLDSHLNMTNDPAKGAQMIDGIVVPPERPGHGAEVIHA